MGDLVKIGVKTALIAGITAAILLLFATVNIPIIDFSGLWTALSKALAIANHWCPVFSTIFPFAVALMGFRIAYYLVEFGFIAVRWIMKVNE